LFIAFRHQTAMWRYFCTAAVLQLHIPQYNMATTKYYHCSAPIFPKLHRHRSLQWRQCYPLLRLPLPPSCHSSLFVACRKVQPVAFFTQRLSESRENRLNCFRGSEVRSTRGTHGLNCNIENLLIAFRLRHEAMTKFLTHRKNTASPRQKSRV
jgi:hypothetical protein